MSSSSNLTPLVYYSLTLETFDIEKDAKSANTAMNDIEDCTKVFQTDNLAIKLERLNLQQKSFKEIQELISEEISIKHLSR